MPVKVQSIIEPYNDSYKVVNAKNIGVGEGDNEKSLDEVLQNLPSGGGSDITVDAELSLTSENPVQNKVIKAALDSTNRNVSSIFQRQEEMGNRLDSLQNQVDNMGGVGGGGSVGGGTGGGVSSWNDLTDKPFGENADGTVKQLDDKYLAPLELRAEETDLLPSFSGMSSFDSNFGVYGIGTYGTLEMFAYWHGISENKLEGNVFVEFDGRLYECTPQRIAAIDNGVAVGNCVPFGGTGNGEPFIVTMLEGGGGYLWQIVALGDTTPAEHTARVYQKMPERYGIKNEYLPILEYKKGIETDILTARLIEGFGEVGDFSNAFQPATIIAPIVGGETYSVYWDGVLYPDLVGVSMDMGNMGVFHALGNMDGISDTPFAIICVRSHEGEAVTNLFISNDTQASHTVRIFQSTPDAYKLKQEYLPFDAIGAYIDNYIDEALGGDY